MRCNKKRRCIQVRRMFSQDCMFEARVIGACDSNWNLLYKNASVQTHQMRTPHFSRRDLINQIERGSFTEFLPRDLSTRKDSKRKSFWFEFLCKIISMFPIT